MVSMMSRGFAWVVPVGLALSVPGVARATPVQIAAGTDHVCGLMDSGAVSCWGENGRGQLGTGSTQPVIGPSKVGLNFKFSHIAAGEKFTCGVGRDAQWTTEGRLYCWGAGSDWRLGNGTGGDRSSPTLVVGARGDSVFTNTTFVSVHAMLAGACALGYSFGNPQQTVVYCWGYNLHGQMGNGSVAVSPNSGQVVARPASLGGGSWGATVELAAGARHMCARSASGDVACWGAGAWGQMGDGTYTVANPQPGLVSLPGVTAVAVAAQEYGACAITSDDRVACWGRNNAQQLRVSSPAASNLPILTEVANKPRQIECGPRHCFLWRGVTRSSSVWEGWGSNAYGELLGSPLPDRADLAPQVMPYPGYLDLFAGSSSFQSCSLATSGEGACWGYPVDLNRSW
jgi:alpha-tubulin suppressor-like RCC1 family protein